MNKQRYIVIFLDDADWNICENRQEMLANVQLCKNIGGVEVYPIGEKVKFREQPRIVEDLPETVGHVAD